MSKSLFYGWWLVLVAFLSQMVGAGAISYAYGLVLTPLAQQLGANRLQMTLGITCMTLAAGIASPLLGAAVDRGSMRLFLSIGALALAAGYTALSLVDAMWQVLVIYAVCMSLAAVLLGPMTAAALLARWFTRQRGRALGIAAMGTAAGGFLFPPLVQMLIADFGWRVACQVLAVASLLLTLPAIALLVVNRPADKQLHADGDATPPPRSASAFASTRSILASRNFWLVGLVMGCLLGMVSAVLSHLLPFALDHGIDSEKGALLLSTLAIAALIGKLAFSALGDAIDLRFVLAAALLLAMIGLGCYFSPSHYAILLLGSAAIGGGSGLALPLWGTLTAQIFGADNCGRVMGLMSPLITALSLLQTPLAGRIRDVTQSYQHAFSVFIVMLLMVLALLPLIRKPASWPAQTEAA